MPVVFVLQALIRLLKYKLLYRLKRSRVLYIVLLFMGVWIASSLLFYYSERIVAGRSDVDLWTSLYWSIITMATIGYGDVTPVRGLGWIVAGFTAVAGIAVYTLTVSVIAEWFISNTISRVMGAKPLKNKSIIVVGDSDACIELIDELKLNNYGDEVGWLTPTQPRVPVDVEYYVGNPGDIEVLKRAGVSRAKHVFLCFTDDSKTLHIALLVKHLNSKASIYAMTGRAETSTLLKEVGVRRVISTSYFGRALASALFEPSVLTTVLELITRAGKGDLVEVVVDEKHSGKTIREIEEELNRDPKFRYRVIAVFRGEEDYTIAPDPNTAVVRGEKLVLVKGLKE